MCRTRRFEIGKSFSIDNRIAGDGYGKIITTVFALVPNLTRYPPDGWVVEQRRFGNPLKDIDDIVMTADVGQFMREESFDMVDRQTRKCANRHQDNWTQPADNSWNLYPGRRQ